MFQRGELRAASTNNKTTSKREVVMMQAVKTDVGKAIYTATDEVA
jgi:hypothetical protein